jgi:hypothetical protein
VGGAGGGPGVPAHRFGEDHGTCYEAYLQNGPTQQLTFDEFHRLYGDTVCAPSGDGLVASHEGQFSEQTR